VTRKEQAAGAARSGTKTTIAFGEQNETRLARARQIGMRADNARSVVRGEGTIRSYDRFPAEFSLVHLTTAKRALVCSVPSAACGNVGSDTLSSQHGNKRAGAKQYD
jgi:hypothetical protein